MQPEVAGTNAPVFDVANGVWITVPLAALVAAAAPCKWIAPLHGDGGA